MTDQPQDARGSLSREVEARLRALMEAEHSRRRFLIGTGAISAVALAACTPLRGGPGGPPAPGPTPPPTVPPAPLATRSLVVIEMAGGHDGYSMAVPFQDPHYYALRPNVSTPAAQVLPIAGHDLGLNPNLPKLSARGLALVEGVGPPAPDESHFDMLRRWWQADIDNMHPQGTGFLGRLCDAVADPTAPAAGVTIAWGTSPALISSQAVTLSMAQDSDGRLSELGGGATAAAWTRAQRAIATVDATEPGPYIAARSGMNDALRFSDAMAALPASTQTYPNTGLGQQLALAARLIRTNVGVKVVHVPFSGGFDTHENHKATHDGLMAELDGALDAFLAELHTQGLTNRVLVANTSEFGRRAGQNQTGLDHGTASVMFLAGAAHTGVYGTRPSWSTLDPDGNLVSRVSLADYYATLAQWFGIQSAAVLPVPGNVIPGIVP
jgi:uncharacterized protein (DUF1501 family)